MRHVALTELEQAKHAEEVAVAAEAQKADAEKKQPADKKNRSDGQAPFKRAKIIPDMHPSESQAWEAFRPKMNAAVQAGCDASSLDASIKDNTKSLLEESVMASQKAASRG